MMGKPPELVRVRGPAVENSHFISWFNGAVQTAQTGAHNCLIIAPPPVLSDRPSRCPVLEPSESQTAD